VQRASQFASLLFGAIGLFMIAAGYRLGLTGEFGPGVGFFGFVIGILLMILSAVWFLQLRRETPAREPLVIERGGLLRAGSVALSLVVFAIAVEPVGFRLTMLALLLFLLIAFNRSHLNLKIVLAVAGSFGTYYVFVRLLRVPLPSASIDFLRNLGL
jgi:putative tricarboxylic transport membrane protein